MLKILDCTLRDGGYCNNWEFGFEKSKAIITSLVKSKVDIIECGFLVKGDYNPEQTRFTDISQINTLLPIERGNSEFVAMMNFGDFDIDTLASCDGQSINGIRVAFHKRDRFAALDVCKKIKAKGYKIYIQAMVSLSYTDIEFLEMIAAVNEFEPYAFYIVDSFGMMKQRDLSRLFFMTENNLKKSIAIGFHSHNNIQLAYSNAQYLIEQHTAHSLLIDASIMGMGRGAGNLNLELFLEHINERFEEAKYAVKPLLTVIDDVLSNFYKQNSWGYSLSNYLSAIMNIHPNYASYLDNKATLSVENIEEILSTVVGEHKVDYDENYIENLYIDYMSKGEVFEQHITELKKMVADKPILLIFPGKCSEAEKGKIMNFSKDCVTISVNFDYLPLKSDYIFVSNLRRFKQLDNIVYDRTIATSNISSVQVYLRVDYAKLLNDQEGVRDNAGLMAIAWLISLNATRIYLAGLDGFSHEADENYAEDKMKFVMKKAMYDVMNTGMQNVIDKYSKLAHIEFITPERYIHVNHKGINQ